MINDFLKIILLGCIIIALYAVNNLLFFSIFHLDTAYVKNIAWSVLFCVFFTVSQIALIRMCAGKLGVKFVWE